MFAKGDYVRLALAPNSQMGTIEDVGVNDRGKVQYRFSRDPRLKYPQPAFFVLEDQIEACKRPNDAEIKHINQFIRR